MSLVSKQAKTLLRCEALEAREMPAVQVLLTDNFDQPPATGLSGDWEQWSSAGNVSFGLSQTRASTGSGSLATTGDSRLSSRIWRGQTPPVDNSISASVLVDSLIPVQLFVRGQNLDSDAASYYAVSVTRGVNIELLRVVNGQSTTLATLKSSSYFSSNWARITLDATGDQLSVQLQRLDTKQYLDAQGAWVSAESTALSAKDGRITDAGQAGINRQARFAGTVYVDDVTLTGDVPLPSPPPPPPVVNQPTSVKESFDTTPVGTLPANWSGWTSSANSRFSSGTSRVYSGTQALVHSASNSGVSARAWLSNPAPVDSLVSAAYYADTLIGAELISRGSNLDTTTPTYYSVTIRRGLSLSLTKVINGQSTELASIQSKQYFSSRWVKVSLATDGDRLRIIAQRLDTNQYLNTAGVWQDDATFALEARDSSIRIAGQVGVGRRSGYTGSLAFDDFEIASSSSDTSPPTMAITAPAANATLTGVVTVRVAATDNVGIGRVEFYLNGSLRSQIISVPYEWTFDSRNEANGAYVLMVRAYDTSGNVSTATRNYVINNSQPTVSRPSVPQHYSHIRIAQLAYAGNPMGSFEKKLLRESVDLVVPNTRFLQTIQDQSPNTPQLIYSNVSNLYLSLLTDWLAYADANNVTREDAFYHVSQATAWKGDSPSSQPVTWFWNVERGAASPTNWQTGFTDRTSQARGSTSQSFSFGGNGEAIYVGNLEKYRELNFTLAKSADSTWNAVYEYVSAVDAQGNPTAWKTLSRLTDSTGNFQRSGQVTFDAPRDWVPASISGSTPQYYVRLRSTAGSEANAPIALRILGRDYVEANGKTTGTIPAFDTSADRDGDGYLNEAEWSRRRTGFDARFYYESRVFYLNYGQQRFVTHMQSTSVQNFLGEYHKTYLQGNPLADGVFIDNSTGRWLLPNVSTIEPTSTYAEEYAATMATIGRVISPKWILANTAGGGTAAEPIIKQVPASIEEFLLRPLTATWSSFLDVSTMVARRQALTDPSGYLILDSLPTGGSVKDPRTQIATLAYYYLLGNPDSTFLMFYGGYDTSSTWTEHWSEAATVDVGKPSGNWMTFASGKDPANQALDYNVYGREYSKSLVLYKPLSYTLRQGTGTLADNTATTHNLNGNYRAVQANGSLGPVINKITLRNGEGAVLIKA